MVYQLRQPYGAIAFDRIGDYRAVILRDSFIGAKTLAAITTSGVLQSELNWRVTDEIGAATADVEVLASEAGNQGIIRLNVGATVPAAGDLVSMALSDNDDGIVLDGNGVYLAAVLRLPDSTNTIVSFGLTVDPAGAPNSSATDVVAWVYENADTAAKFLAQLNYAGTDVETASTITYVQDDWVVLEIAADDTGATFRITTEDGSEVIELDGAIVTPLVPAFQVENVGAAEEFIEIDTFVLRYFVRDDSTMLGA